jgi:beta-N-acetylhexosaminidase
VEAGVASLMTAHVSFPALDGDRPATLSPPIMAICREELGYDGVVFSDDLEMKAVADRYSPEELVSGALESHVDAFLVCKDAALRDRILARLECEPAERLAEPLRRVAALKQRYAPGGRASMRTPAASGPPPYPKHQLLAERLRGSGN